MNYRVVACDYDGTLAHDGVLDGATVAALDRCRASGRRLVMVTGRELDELKQVCQALDRFEWIVAENGALLYAPASAYERLLCEQANAEVAARLRAADVEPLSIGRAIIATREPHEVIVGELIKELGLKLQVIFNKGAVMVLPAGVSKASGLAAALSEMGCSAAQTVGVGDAENDQAFLEVCGVSVAVNNAVSVLKQRADLVTAGARGVGVSELIDHLIANDLADVSGRQPESQPVSAGR